jgi:hypothetical protein
VERSEDALRYDLVGRVEEVPAPDRELLRRSLSSVAMCSTIDFELELFVFVCTCLIRDFVALHKPQHVTQSRFGKLIRFREKNCLYTIHDAISVLPRSLLKIHPHFHRDQQAPRRRRLSLRGLCPEHSRRPALPPRRRVPSQARTPQNGSEDQAEDQAQYPSC